MPIFDGQTIKPIKEFEEAYKEAICRCEKSNCKNCHSKNEACLNYTSCGPDNMCDFPCRHCIAWEAYGGLPTVRALRKKIKQAKRSKENG